VSRSPTPQSSFEMGAAYQAVSCVGTSIVAFVFFRGRFFIGAGPGVVLARTVRSSLRIDFQRLRSNLCRRRCACVCVLRMQQCSPQVRPIRTFGMRAISAISPISQLQPRAAPMSRLAGRRKAGGKVGCWERAPLLPAQHREAASLCWAERPAAKAFGPTFPPALR
jgi:hypothetical protein